MFGVIAGAARANARGLGAVVMFAAWAIAAIATSLLARLDWLIILIPIASAAAIVIMPWPAAYRQAFLICAVGLYAGSAALEVTIRLRSFGPDALIRPAEYGPFGGLALGIVVPTRDPAVPYRFMPGLRTRYQGQDLDVNAQGFRGVDFTELPTAGVARIAAFGSSVTMGAGVAERDAYPAASARALAVQGTPAEALNFGLPGYTPSNIFDLAERMTPIYRPEFVVVEIPPMQLRDDGSSPADSDVVEAEAMPVSTVERYSFAATALYPPFGLRNALRRIVDRGPRTAASTSYIESRVTELAALGRKNGFRLYVLAIRPMADFDRPDRDRPDLERIAAACRAAGATMVDTYPLFQPGEFPDDFFIFPGDPHPNAVAHARFAQALAEAIASR